MNGNTYRNVNLHLVKIMIQGNNVIVYTLFGDFVPLILWYLFSLESHYPNGPCTALYTKVYHNIVVFQSPTRKLDLNGQTTVLNHANYTNQYIFSLTDLTIDLRYTCTSSKNESDYPLSSVSIWNTRVQVIKRKDIDKNSTVHSRNRSRPDMESLKVYLLSFLIHAGKTFFFTVKLEHVATDQ